MNSAGSSSMDGSDMGGGQGMPTCEWMGTGARWMGPRTESGKDRVWVISATYGMMEGDKR